MKRNPTSVVPSGVSSPYKEPYSNEANVSQSYSVPIIQAACISGRSADGRRVEGRSSRNYVEGSSMANPGGNEGLWADGICGRYYFFGDGRRDPKRRDVLATLKKIAALPHSKPSTTTKRRPIFSISPGSIGHQPKRGRNAQDLPAVFDASRCAVCLNRLAEERWLSVSRAPSWCGEGEARRARHDRGQEMGRIKQEQDGVNGGRGEGGRIDGRALWLDCDRVLRICMQAWAVGVPDRMLRLGEISALLTRVRVRAE